MLTAAESGESIKSNALFPMFSIILLSNKIFLLIIFNFPPFVS